MIPRDIYAQINPGTSDNELRDLADSNALSYSELWTARLNKRRWFNAGVDSVRKRYRR